MLESLWVRPRCVTRWSACNNGYAGVMVVMKEGVMKKEGEEDVINNNK